MLNRASLKQAYELAQTKTNQETMLRQKACVEECLQIIEKALINHDNSYVVLKVNLVQVTNINKQVMHEISKELNQLEIDHSFQHYAGCQREAPEAFFLIKF